MSYRPKYTRKDENHYCIRDFMKTFCGGYEERKDGSTYIYTANYRGHKIIAYDMSNYGGSLVDWLLESVDFKRFMWVEVKIPETLKKDLSEFRAGTFKPGEEWIMTNSTSWKVVVDEPDVKDLFAELVRSK